MVMISRPQLTSSIVNVLLNKTLIDVIIFVVKSLAPCVDVDAKCSTMIQDYANVSTQCEAGGDTLIVRRQNRQRTKYPVSLKRTS